MVQKSDVNNMLKVSRNQPCANLGIQNGRHYLVFIIFLQQDIVQMQKKLLYIGLHKSNVKKSFITNIS